MTKKTLKKTPETSSTGINADMAAISRIVVPSKLLTNLNQNQKSVRHKTAAHHRQHHKKPERTQREKNVAAYSSLRRFTSSGEYEEVSMAALRAGIPSPPHSNLQPVHTHNNKILAPHSILQTLTPPCWATIKQPL
jgi:hypothetical protein